MKISLEYPDELDKEVLHEAEKDGHKNRSALIRKALLFYLSQKSPKVTLCNKEVTEQKQATH